jgi:Putative Ig domain
MTATVQTALLTFLPMLNKAVQPSPTPSPTSSPTPSPTPSPSPTSSDYAGAIPNWLLIALLVVVTLVIVAMFGLTFYNLSAPRSTLKNILGQKRNKPDASMQKEVSPKVVETLSSAARVNTRTTRTTLAIAGFALLGIVVVAMFGLSGQGVRDLRGQVIAAITTLVAAIAGFYFGSRGRGPETASGNGGNRVAPGLGPDPDHNHVQFRIGISGTYRPVLSGTPAPTVTITSGILPADLGLDPTTGSISGIPAPGTRGDYTITLTASNGTTPDATLTVKLTVTP